MQYDLKNRRTFLKRMDYPAVTQKDLVLNGVITVYSRQLKIAEYGDAYTASVCGTKAAAVVVRVAPPALSSMGRILDSVAQSGLAIGELRLLSDGLALKLMGESSAEVWSSLAPQINATLGDGAVSTLGDDVFATPLPKPSVADIETSSLLLVRAHAIKAGVLGRVVDQILGSGFEVLNAAMLQLSRPNATEFLEVYRGVVPECVDWMDELTSGKVVALQLRYTDDPTATVLRVRELCGAHDPEIAQHLHPNSLRAQYGESKVKNAVHCTDLPEDGPLEVQYFFQILEGGAAA
jgi:nucleoside-diphosphate kinase